MQLPYTLTEDFDLAFYGKEGQWFDKAHADDAAYDLRAAEARYLFPGEPVKVPTGLRLAIPEGYAGLVLPRSGLASRGVTVANSPGLIDPGYRGEVGVLLLYHYGPQHAPDSAYFIQKGDRIAQLLFVKTADLTPLYVKESDFDWHTERGEGGFGSTGR